jgi:hypothetical protein
MTALSSSNKMGIVKSMDIEATPLLLLLSSLSCWGKKNWVGVAAREAACKSLRTEKVRRHWEECHEKYQ